MSVEIYSFSKYVFVLLTLQVNLKEHIIINVMTPLM